MQYAKYAVFTIVIVSALSVTACSSSGGAGAPPGDAAATDTGAATTDAGADAENVVRLSGSIVTAPSFVPTAGVQECVLDSGPPLCSTSAQGGLLTISLPADSLTGLMLTPPDAIPTLSPIATHDAGIVLTGRTGWSNGAAGVVIPTAAVQTVLVEPLGVQLDPSKGYVDFDIVNLNGGTVTIEGGTTATEWYLAGSTAALAASLDGGALPVGAAIYGFLNVDPGMVTFRVEKNGTPCEWDPVVWPGAEPGTVTVPIRAGTWTRLFEAKCP